MRYGEPVSQTLHPYYDDVTNEQWLYAEVIETTPAAMRFHVSTPDGLDNILAKRIEHHFKTLKLDKLYRSQAAVELASIRVHITGLFENVAWMLYVTN
ncbi:MAG: hypothetical protein JXD22_11425 [Sedimentisphaerales bacterium]|nr:hypothetical protein [Sedimentisphaerales bacterium]